jgi:hypothetical protein
MRHIIHTVALAAVVTLAGAACGSSGTNNPPQPPASAPVVSASEPGVTDSAAESTLRNAAVAAQVCFGDAASYRGCDASKLRQIEPALTFVDAPAASTDPRTVSVASTGPDTFSATVLSDAGVCYVILVNELDPPVVTPEQDAAAQGKCTAQRAE